MPPAGQIYERLTGGGAPPLGDAFDRHVAASAIAISLAECDQNGLCPSPPGHDALDPPFLLTSQGDWAACPVPGRTLVRQVGLEGAQLGQLAEAFFPHAAAWLLELAGPYRVHWAADEDFLRDLLWRTSTGATGYQRVLADIIARRAQGPNHLWQDLGLRDRGDLSQLMQRHFAPLKARNIHDMKWKKFLYRTICRDDGHGFCAAPTCAECDEFAICFGDEAGDSLLGQVAALDQSADQARLTSAKN